jgi:hypothetical protein
MPNNTSITTVWATSASFGIPHLAELSFVSPHSTLFDSSWQQKRATSPFPEFSRV